jgi:hypothetical protein
MAKVSIPIGKKPRMSWDDSNGKMIKPREVLGAMRGNANLQSTIYNSK